MRTTQVLLFILVILLTGPALAATPGFINLEFITVPDDADEIQDVDLGPVLKDVVRDAKNNDDLEIAELLSMVTNLRMRSFSLDEESTDQARKDMKKVARRLKEDDWSTLMKFKDGDELTTISTKYHDDNMVGLTVVVFAPEDQALFINVVGDLDLGKLMRLAGELDEDDLEEYLDKVDGEHHIHID